MPLSFVPGKQERSCDRRILVTFSREHFDPRSKRTADGKSKSWMVVEYLRDHSDRAFFSSELSELLKDRGIKPCDIMASVRRYQRRGLVMVRGYNTDNNLTPFRQGSS